MIEVTCQTCAEKVGVESFLAAAQQPCGRCGHLLMGALDRGTRTARPAGFGDLPPPPFEHRGGSVAGVWLGVLAGGIIGLGAVCGVGFLGPAIPHQVRGALLGALTGVLLVPVLALGSFVMMFVPPFNLLGMIGESAWSRLAKALHQRSLRHLIFPVFVFVVLPMGLCAMGGSRLKVIDTPALMAAGLGAVVLGAVVGGVCGNRSR